jgi:hypothetical protein
MTPDPSAPAVALPAHAAAAPADEVRPNYKLLGLLALGHLVIDTNQGSLPALLPYLKAALGWVADHWGLSSALWISALMPILGCAVSLTLPEPRSR